MAITPEKFSNATSDFLSLLISAECLKGNYFGFIFCYCVLPLCFLLGIPAHLWCLWFYFYTEQKIKETHFFFLTHTIMELIYCLECAVQTLSVLNFNNKLCWALISFLFGLSWTGRPLLQTCICIEQYLAVLHPVTFFKYKGIRYRIAGAGVAWLIASAYGVYEIYMVIFPDFFFTFLIIITMTVISFCCLSVLCALKNPGPGDSRTIKHTTRAGGNQQKRKAFNIIFAAFLLSFFTYLPLALLIVVSGRFQEDAILLYCSVVPFMASLNVFGVIITPLLKIYKENNHKCLNGQYKIKKRTP